MSCLSLEIIFQGRSRTRTQQHFLRGFYLHTEYKARHFMPMEVKEDLSIIVSKAFVVTERTQKKFEQLSDIVGRCRSSFAFIRALVWYPWLYKSLIKVKSGNFSIELLNWLNCQKRVQLYFIHTRIFSSFPAVTKCLWKLQPKVKLGSVHQAFFLPYTLILFQLL